jgi:hypothetical protein
VAAIQRALEGGPLVRDLLRERVASAGVRTQGQAFVHLLVLASIRGLIVRGPVLGARQAFVLVHDWLGNPRPVDRDAALGELARRYLAGHGPANPADLAKWAGLPLRDARAGLEAIVSELHEDEGGLVDLRRSATTSVLPEPQLLGAFEPVLLGWKSRDAILGDDAGRVVSGGLFRAFALVDGRAVATWTISRGIVELEPFRPIGSTDRAALETEAADVTRFLHKRA